MVPDDMGIFDRNLNTITYNKHYMMFVLQLYYRYMELYFILYKILPKMFIFNHFRPELTLNFLSILALISRIIMGTLY